MGDFLLLANFSISSQSSFSARAVSFSHQYLTTVTSSIKDSTVMSSRRDYTVTAMCRFISSWLLSSHMVRCYKTDLAKLQLAQNRGARLAFHCNVRANINNMHASLSWIRVEERLTALLLKKKRSYVKLDHDNVLKVWSRYYSVVSLL
jgi:hypothetical protein